MHTNIWKKQAFKHAYKCMKKQAYKCMKKHIQMYEKNTHTNVWKKHAYKHAYKCMKKTRIQMYEKNMHTNTDTKVWGKKPHKYIYIYISYWFCTIGTVGLCLTLVSAVDLVPSVLGQQDSFQLLRLWQDGTQLPLSPEDLTSVRWSVSDFVWWFLQHTVFVCAYRQLSWFAKRPPASCSLLLEDGDSLLHVY